MLEHGGRLRAAAQRFGIPLADWLDLSTGIAPWPYPLPAPPAEVWQRLPEDDDGLLATAQTYYGAANLLALPGSQAGIQRLPHLLPPARVAMPSPIYNEHPAAWQTVQSMAVPGENLLAWLGPAIGPQQFEVGDEVRAIFIAADPQAAAAFVVSPPDSELHPKSHPESCKTAPKWLCNIHLLARQRLAALGVHCITSADFCTVRDTAHFYSYRRDGVSGRMASLIWRI